MQWVVGMATLSVWHGVTDRHRPTTSSSIRESLRSKWNRQLPNLLCQSYPLPGSTSHIKRVQAHGHIKCTLENGRPMLNIQDAFPLKLISPKSYISHHIPIYALTYGGGLVGGDMVELTINVGTCCNVSILNSGSTKVLKQKSKETLPSQQLVDAHVSGTGRLAVLPEPVTCFEGSWYIQNQRFSLDKDASLVLLDWLTSGRRSRGEEWKFRHYHSQNRIDVDGQTLVSDAFTLQPDETGKIGGFLQYACYATLILVGPKTETARTLAVAEHATLAFGRGEPVKAMIWTVSVINDGIVIRAAAAETDDMRTFLKNTLACLADEIGDYFGKC
jgi:urease accessory protein